MQYSRIVILLIFTSIFSCTLLQVKTKNPKTITKKQKLINFRIEINEVEDVEHDSIKAKLFIKNIYFERIRFQIPDCLRIAAPDVRYNNGIAVPMRSTIKEVCEPEWKELEPGHEFMSEFPYNIFELYYLEPGDEITVQFSYFGEIRDSKSEFLSGNDDVIQSNLRKLRLVEN